MKLRNELQQFKKLTNAKFSVVKEQNNRIYKVITEEFDSLNKAMEDWQQEYEKGFDRLIDAIEEDYGDEIAKIKKRLDRLEGNK